MKKRKIPKKVKHRIAPKVARRRGLPAAELNKKIALFKRERDEALEQQAAASEILGVISNSPADLQPVFESIVQSAARLCEATNASLYRVDGNALRHVANYGRVSTLNLGEARPITPGSLSGGAIIGRKIVHVRDALAVAEARFPDSRSAIEREKIRSSLAVPLLRGKKAYGVIIVRRDVVRPFSDKQISLLKTFADQAVIAIENTRLLSELRQRTDDLSEALYQQTATSEVLKVISSSPDDLGPVFTTMIENATRLCEAKVGTFALREDAGFRGVAVYGHSTIYADVITRFHQPPPETGLYLLEKTRQTVEIPDIAASTAYEEICRLNPDFGKVRTGLFVPVVKESSLIGAFMIYRHEVRPFTDKQIELVKNFAAQAVIAIENTRLLKELRQRTDDLSESLDQQTATSEVLKVISSSPGALEPVFQAMLANATHICAAQFGVLYRLQGPAFRPTAWLGVTPALADYLKNRGSDPPTPGTPLARLLNERKGVAVQTADAAAELGVGAPARLGGARSLVAVPMLKDNELVGAIIIYRTEVRPFTDKQVQLVSNFAAQAVIAIENTRLLNELRQRTDDLTEALEQQTATSEVLKVISRSPGELEPVFRAMLENAVSICEAQFGNLALYDGRNMRMAAMHNAPQAYDALRRDDPVIPLDRSLMGPLVAAKNVVRFDDLAAAEPSASWGLVKVAGARSAVGVPLLKDKELVGAIVIYRTEPRPFADKQVELLTNFAAQAVIAIENTRLLNELRQRTDDLSESLEQQTATSEVLQVISTSPGELGPVFQAMLENATRICEANFGVLNLHEEGKVRMAAMHNVPAAFADFLQSRDRAYQPIAGSLLDQVIRTKQVGHTADNTIEAVGRAATLGGAKSTVCVPMLKDDDLIGTITIYRQEVRPFTDKQIALLQNFAAQAVIAIENTRLLNELRQRTDDLSEALEQQTGTSEVLKIVSSSPGNLEPVFESMLTNASRICRASYGTMFLCEGEALRTVAIHGALPPAWTERWQPGTLYQPETGLLAFQAVKMRQPVQVPDLRATPGYLAGTPSAVASAEIAGIRTMINVPMLRDDEVIGVVSFYRTEVRTFTEKQIALVSNFAAQAVIAIENTRLLNELRQRTDDLSEALEQQTATSEVLKVISSSPGDLEPVFQTMLENATRICDAKFGTLLRFDGKHFYAAAQHNTLPELAEYHRRRGPIQPMPGTLLDRLMQTKQVCHTPDAAAEPIIGASARLGGARSYVAVPMLKDSELVGAITIYRQEVRPFTDKQVEVVQNFAAQAVIAIENTRLLNELRQRTDDLSEALEQQTATSEVLKAISSSPGELAPVFQAMLENATRICNAKFGTLFLAEGGALQVGALHNLPPRLAEFIRKRGTFVPPKDSAVGRMLRSKEVIHNLDDAAEPFPTNAAKLGGARTYLAVPMLNKDEFAGFFAIYRQEVRPFTAKQVELLSNFAAQAVIAIENARLLNELRESLQQQTATSEVLKVISSSPGELDPVFRAMLENAVRICEAKFGRLFLVDGDRVRLMADLGVPAALTENTAGRDTFQPMVGGPLENLLRNKKIAHVPDILAAYPDHPAATLGGARSFIAVPMLKEDALIGLIVIYRQEVQPFTAKQIELVQNFAAQAVIAIENARLLSELRESLERQTATANILRVIAASPGEVEGSLREIAETTARLFGAVGASFRIAEGDALKLSVGVGQGAEQLSSSLYADPAIRPTVGGRNLPGTVIRENRQIHLSDLDRLDDEFADWPGPPVARRAGIRTMVGTPLRIKGRAIGALMVYRNVLRPFEAAELQLLQSFADQAVIAIENARLLNELRQRTDDLSEALEQQTATSEVLNVISNSLVDTQPVFDAIVRTGLRLFADAAIVIMLPRGDQAVIEAIADNDPVRAEGLKRRSPIPLRREYMHSLAIIDGKTVDVPDVNNPPAELAAGAQNFRAGGFNAVTIVPMMRSGVAIGALSVARPAAGPLSKKQHALFETFAAQAVIAIENTRLLSELRQRTDDLSESLEQQTATSEVLKVISSSPGDLEPVFQAMLENAMHICEAKFGIMFKVANGVFHLLSSLGLPPAFSEFQREPRAWGPDTGLGRILLAKQTVHVTDTHEGRAFAERDSGRVAAVEMGGVRSFVAVPMLKDNEVIGAFIVFRQEVRPFTDKQISLVSNFAAQAVIAIENTRLLKELRQRTDDLTESLQYQTATGEILGVISKSPTQVQPVFDIIAASALRLCNSTWTSVLRFDGEMIEIASLHNMVDFDGAETIRSSFPRKPSRTGATDRAISTKSICYIPDVLELPDYDHSTLAQVAGYRSILSVPMLRDGQAVGAITAVGAEPNAFSERQIALLRTFADQAVIAIENVRLFDDVQKRTLELSEALEQQAATSEVLNVISRSKFDLQPILQSVVDTAARLCRADTAVIFRLDHGIYRFAAGYCVDPQYMEIERATPITPGPGTVVGRTAMRREVVRIVDAMEDPLYEKKQDAEIAQVRSMIGVPLMREGEPIGVIALVRQRVEPFIDREIELVSTFADQAAIAIENVRLFENVEARTRELAKSLDDLQMAQDRLVQTEKLASLGQLTAGIAHEIKNPLNFVNNFSSLSVELIDELRVALGGVQLDQKLRTEINEIADMLQGNLDKVVQHGKRADSIVKNMLLHSRQGSGDHRSVDLNALVEESLNLAYHGARAEKQGFNISLEKTFDPAASEVDLFPQEITRVLLNLISNGFYAATKRKAEAHGGSYEPTLTVTTKSLGDSVEIRIRDNGTGIPPEVKEKMFNPFFTTKPAGEGTGLGLSLSYDIIVKQHAGSIEVDTQPGEFTEFRIVLPRGAATIAKSGERT